MTVRQFENIEVRVNGIPIKGFADVTMSDTEVPSIGLNETVTTSWRSSLPTLFNVHTSPHRPLDPCWDAKYRSKHYVCCDRLHTLACGRVSCPLLWIGVSSEVQTIRPFTTLRRPIGWPRKDWFSRPRGDRTMKGRFG